MPTKGVKETLQRLDKDGQSRQIFGLYDVANDEEMYEEKRTLASQGKIRTQDIALIAYKFKVSYQAAVYKLSDIGYLNRRETNQLINQQYKGKEFLEILKLTNDKKTNDDETINENDRRRRYVPIIGGLALEAYTRKLISKNRLLNISQMLEIDGTRLLQFAENL